MSSPLLETLPIYSKRLEIRPLENRDLPDLNLLFSNPEVMRYSLSGTMTPDQIEERLSLIKTAYTTDGYHYFGLFEREDPDHFLGVAGLLNQEVDGEQFVELGYRLMAGEWGFGYATEAGEAIRDWAFENLEIKRLISLIEPSNEASIRVAKRVGMRLWKRTQCFGVKCHVYSLKPIELVLVDSSWEARFREEKQRLALIDNEIRFFPIGSTSIPGIVAKPILDILGVVSDLTQVDRL